ncbi:MAG: TlpA family protein disulfide reductase [Gammaproteobacteria bacterium]|nr:TlpA family protein disulfide reductase [Gammaproteobacteria bacterium]
MAFARKWALLAISVLVVFLAAAASLQSVYLLDNGEEIDFDDVAGKWVIISYWASWCGPCREEIRILNSIHRDRAKHNVIVLGLNYDGVQGEQLAQQKDRWGAEYPDLLENPRLRWDEPRPDFIPRTLIVDPDGELLTAIAGTTTRNQILSKISR